MTYPANPPEPDNGYATSPADNADSDYYSQLSPYGTWTYVAGYGWCWQAYPWLATTYYPWGVLGYGYWGYWPSRGWCWIPRSHYGYAYRGAYVGNHFVGNFNNGRTFGQPSVAVHSFGRSAVSTRFGGSAVHFSGGGHFGGMSGGRR